MNHRIFANALRILSMDAVQQANSGHPGAPLGMADIAEVLWRQHLKHNPADPAWPDRDRFVLSNGHGSMLLYSLLHLSGYDLPMSELQRFRQLHSKTPGHPEVGVTPGVETSTGPLGQGLANAVGLALAEKLLAAQFNRPGHELVDHHTYVFLGDGCLMEGLSHEVGSLAGTLGLGKLIAFWDDNGISIDGKVEGWFTDDTPKRFEAYGWQVIPAVDGHDAAAIEAAIRAAKAERERPTLICCKTLIGCGAPTKAGSHHCHGAPLGAAEIAAARQALDWPHPPFVVPEEIYAAWDARAAGLAAQLAWQARFDAYRRAHPDLAQEFERRMAGELPPAWSATLAERLRQWQAEPKAEASRQSSQQCLHLLGELLPELLGGSADLAPSNLTLHRHSRPVGGAQPDGNYLHYGVREFGMSAIMNGLALHGGFIPYGGTFLVFMEYARNAVRMAALMRQRVLFVYTHDSIGLGEDGPTHQPVEQLASLRQTPNLETWRPCDRVETAVAWQAAIERTDGPSALIFSRQALPQMARSPAQLEAVTRGGYILRDTAGMPDLILLATGSEVALAMAAAEALAERAVLARVVSMPCTERFDAQDAAYREQVLPRAVRRRLAVEAGHADFWRKYVGLDGDVLGMSRFGESAPAEDLLELFGFTREQLLARCLALLAQPDETQPKSQKRAAVISNDMVSVP